MKVGLSPDNVGQDPQLDETADHADPPVPHQHLPRGLVLKEEVGDGVGDLALHLLSSAGPWRGGSLSVSLYLSHPSPHKHLKKNNTKNKESQYADSTSSSPAAALCSLPPLLSSV